MLNTLFKKILFIQPILLGGFFILLRYSQNVDELVFTDLLYVLMIIIPSIAAFSIIIRLIIKDTTKSLLISSFVVLLFFTYIPLHDAIYQVQIGELQLGKHTVLFPLISICSLIAIVFFVKSKREFGKLLEISFAIILVLIIFNTVEIGYYSDISYSVENDQIQLFSIDKSNYRNVYHIVLDEFGGTESLQKYLGFDNSDFDNSLRDLGFFIPEETHSNYIATRLSLPSILNMDYIHNDLPMRQKEVEAILKEKMANSLVPKIFKENGYDVIYFHNEVNLRPTKNPDRVLCNDSVGNIQFFSFILDNTPIILVDRFFDPGSYNEYAKNRLCVFNELSSLDETLSGPTYVLAHIMLPHTPFIFDADGNINKYEKTISPEKQSSLYISQVQYTDTRILQIVKELLTKEPHPIIIIQSDHGYRSDNEDADGLGRSFSNFVAYYLPTTESKDMPENLSGVNTYRILFNEYFGTSYDILENRMYIFDITRTIDVTDILLSEKILNMTDVG